MSNFVVSSSLHNFKKYLIDIFTDSCSPLRFANNDGFQNLIKPFVYNFKIKINRKNIKSIINHEAL